MSDDHVYMSLAEGHEEEGDARWAFGTGFEDPLYGVDTDVPAGVDRAELTAWCLALGDDALISAQRLAEWCTRAPELEEELALANIGLDLLGQARLLYSRAGQVDGTGRGEDAYAYFRDPAEFRNVRLAELPNGDFAFSIARLLVLSAWRLATFEQLAAAAVDPVLAAVAAKGVKELTYHRQYAADWVVRFGDGTEESHRRMRAALQAVAPYLDELFTAGTGTGAGTGTSTGPGTGPGVGADPAEIRAAVTAVFAQVTKEARLDLDLLDAPARPGHGRDGQHTEHLAPLLDELQGLARAHPEATW